MGKNSHFEFKFKDFKHCKFVFQYDLYQELLFFLITPTNGMVFKKTKICIAKQTSPSI